MVAIDAIKRDSGVGIIIDRVKVSYKEMYGAGTFIVRSMHDWKIELETVTASWYANEI
jgi:hypothetical protein